MLLKEKTWKRIFNINNELSQNRIEKQIMPLKTTLNWLFNDIWRYLVIASFDWKIGIFRQTVVRVYCIVNIFCKILKKTNEGAHFLEKLEVYRQQLYFNVMFLHNTSTEYLVSRWPKNHNALLRWKSLRYKLFHVYLRHVVVFDKWIMFLETLKCKSAVELAWIHYK